MPCKHTPTITVTPDPDAGRLDILATCPCGRWHGAEAVGVFVPALARVVLQTRRHQLGKIAVGDPSTVEVGKADDA